MEEFTEVKKNERNLQLESLIKYERKDFRKNLAKMITVPALFLGGIAVGSALLTYPLENHDLRYLLNIGISISGGATFGYYSIRYAGEKLDDMRDSLESIKAYKREFADLSSKGMPDKSK